MHKAEFKESRNHALNELATPAGTHTHIHTRVRAGSNFLSVMSKTNSSVFDLPKTGEHRKMYMYIYVCV